LPPKCWIQKQQKKHLELENLNLTLKEKEILNLLVKGNSYKEIAGMIFISVETLKLAYQEYLPEGKWSLPG